MALEGLVNALGEAFQGIGTYTAQAAAQANQVSAQAQSAQGAFNQQSANQANMITDNRLASQYGYNAAQAAMANQYNTEAWQRAADWNEAMWEKQAAFNAEQAQIQRDWQEMMSNTQYQRTIKDMEKAGLNPVLAVTGGGMGNNVPSGASASVGGAQMSSAQANMASGGLLGAESAQVGNYSGQMEYMSGLLGTISALFQGISNAQSAVSDLSDFGIQDLDEDMAEGIIDLFMGSESTTGQKIKEYNNALSSRAKYAFKTEGLKGLWNFATDYYKDYWSMSNQELYKKYNN